LHIERQFGEQLGLNIETGIVQRFSTATGTFLAYGHNVTLITEGLEFDSYIFFYADENHKPNVLGRFGWLDRICLGLIDYEGKLFLNYYVESELFTVDENPVPLKLTLKKKSEKKDN